MGPRTSLRAQCLLASPLKIPSTKQSGIRGLRCVPTVSVEKKIAATLQRMTEEATPW